MRLDPADVLMVEDDPGDALIAAVGRLARYGAVRYVCGYDLHAGMWVHSQAGTLDLPASSRVFFGATPRRRFRAFILGLQPCSVTARRAGVPARWPAGSPGRWRSVQGTRDVGHLQVEQSGGLELRGDPPD